jgi:hypothetical protein
MSAYSSRSVRGGSSGATWALVRRRIDGYTRPRTLAAAAFTRLARRPIPTNVVWDETQRHSERLRGHLERQQASVGVERVVLPPASADHDQPPGVSLDGGKMNIRGEGWKELKAGTVFELVALPEKDAETGEWVDQVPVVRPQNWTGSLEYIDCSDKEPSHGNPTGI